jgi:hypothetical protein
MRGVGGKPGRRICDECRLVLAGTTAGRRRADENNSGLTGGGPGVWVPFLSLISAHFPLRMLAQGAPAPWVPFFLARGATPYPAAAGARPRRKAWALLHRSLKTITRPG